jgi:AraC family transcriptional regulator
MFSVQTVREPPPVWRHSGHNRPDISWESEVMQLEEPGPGSPSGPLAARRQFAPLEASAVSEQLGWVGLEAARYRASPASEIHQPPLTHHTLILYTRPPEELELWCDGVNRSVRPATGSISVVAAGQPVRWRWRGCKDALHVYLEPGLVARVAAEAFGLDPARVTVPLLAGQDFPQLRAAMLALDAELTAGDAGGRLAAESLANVLAVHLIRRALAPCRLARGPDGALPRERLRAVIAYIEDHLDARPTLAQLAAVAHLSPYHFARQFKAATGLPPHQYVILRRLERAKHLLQCGGEHSLAEIAACAGFSDQSQFSRQFKRVVGVTPGQFRMSAGIA